MVNFEHMRQKEYSDIPLLQKQHKTTYRFNINKSGASFCISEENDDLTIGTIQFIYLNARLPEAESLTRFLMENSIPFGQIPYVLDSLGIVCK